jgi:hypothetical protein
VTSLAPLTTRLTATVPAQIAGTDADQIVARAPYAGTVSRVALISEAAVTGATATKRTFTLTNKGSDGSGTTAAAILDLTTGTDLVAFDETDFTLQGDSDLIVAEGDILALVETHASTGTAHSGGQVVVEITRS